MIKLSRGSYASLVAFSMEAAPLAIGISPVILVAGEDGWLVPLIALPVVLLLIWPLFRLFSSHGEALFRRDISSRSLSIALFPLSLLLLFLVMFNTRVYVDLIHMTYLPQTPEMVINLCVLGVCAYAAILGGEVIGRVALIAFTVKFLVILAAPFFAIGQFQIQFLTPFLANGITPVIRSSIQPVSWFAESAVLVLIWPLVKEGRYRTVAYGYLLGMVSVWIFTISCLLIFSAPLTFKFVYPALEFVQMMALGDFLERIDAVLASIWTMSMVVKISVYLYLLSIVVNRMFESNLRSRFVYGLALFCSWGADKIANNFPQYMTFFRYAWPVLAAVLLLNLLLIGWLCKRLQQKQPHAPTRRAGPQEEADTVSR